MVTAETEAFIKLIRDHLPDCVFQRAEPLPSPGQFNTVLTVDDKWMFRFPKSPAAAADLARELDILPRLQGKLPFPIPQPRFHAFDATSGYLLFMGYRRLPGEPLMQERFARLRDDEAVLAGFAKDLALFLRKLHAITPAEHGLAPTGDSALAEWTRIGEAIREKLFPHMRSDAREAVDRNFEKALNDTDLWLHDECLIHGDFGTGNILFHNGRVSGVIDFGFCARGDPAQDLGALLASYGEPFVEQVFQHYPALRPGLRRARFYQSNYALIQALYALRDDDAAEFEDGISAYR